MPEISLFYGIRVTMYYEDHNPPHFYAENNENKAIVDIKWSESNKRSFTVQTIKTDISMVRDTSGWIDAKLGTVQRWTSA